MDSHGKHSEAVSYTCTSKVNASVWKNIKGPGGGYEVILVLKKYTCLWNNMPPPAGNKVLKSYF